MPTLNFAYSNYTRYQISAQFQSILIFGPNLPKKGVLVQNRKSEYHHQILHIRISLGNKSQLKLTILTFLDQICPKRGILVKNNESDH